MRQDTQILHNLHRSHRLEITQVHFTAASPQDRESGLIGYVAATLNSTVRLDGIAVRRAVADGHLILSFPSRRDAQGQLHPYYRPLDDATRRDIEGQVFAALGIQEISR